MCEILVARYASLSVVLKAAIPLDSLHLFFRLGIMNVTVIKLLFFFILLEIATNGLPFVCVYHSKSQFRINQYENRLADLFAFVRSLVRFMLFCVCVCFPRKHCRNCGNNLNVFSFPICALLLLFANFSEYQPHYDQISMLKHEKTSKTESTTTKKKHIGKEMIFFSWFLLLSRGNFDSYMYRR